MLLFVNAQIELRTQLPADQTTKLPKKCQV